MKRCKRLLIIVFILMLTLTSCGSELTTDGQGDKGDYCKQSVFISGTSNLAVAPGGYYYLDTRNKNGFLTYISKKNAKETYLCNKPECSHIDKEVRSVVENCNAYVGTVLPRSVVYYEGYVYVLQYNADTYDVTLVRISEDGSVHEELMKVGQAPEQASYYSYVFGDKSTIYMVYNAPDYTGEELSVSLEKIDLNKKEKSVIYTHRGHGASLAYLKVQDDMVFFTQVDKGDKGYLHQLMKYDPDKKQVENVIDVHINTYTFAKEGQLFVGITGEGVFKYDWQNDELVLFRKSDEKTMYVSLAIDGEYLYLDNMQNRFYNNDNEHRVYVYDLEGNLVNEVLGGILYTEVCDYDYMFTTAHNGNGEYWTYIKKEDLRNADVTWSAVEER